MKGRFGLEDHLLAAEDGARTETSISKSSSHPTAAWLQFRPSLAGSPAVSALMKASSNADIIGFRWLHRYSPASDVVASATIFLQILLGPLPNQIQDLYSTFLYRQSYRLPSAKHQHEWPPELSVEAAAIFMIELSPGPVHVGQRRAAEPQRRSKICPQGCVHVTARHCSQLITECSG